MQRPERDGRSKERNSEGAYRSLFPSGHDHDLVQIDDPIQTEDSRQLSHYDSENTVDVESSMLEIDSLIGLTSTLFPSPVAEDLSSSDNTSTFQVHPCWQISDDSPLPTAECVVCSEQDHSKLRSCRILKEKRGKEITGQQRFYQYFIIKSM